MNDLWKALETLLSSLDLDKGYGDELDRYAELVGLRVQTLLKIKSSPHWLTGAIWNCVLSACFLRYWNALKLGDNFASDTSLTAWNVMLNYTTKPERDHMDKLYEEGES